MIEGIKEWLLGLIAAAMCLSVLYALLPKGAIQAIAKVTGGMVLLLVLLRPLLGAKLDGIELRYDDYQQQIDSQISTYREAHLQQMETLIQQETGAYISEKAGQMGISCEIQVETQLVDGVPVPTAVWLETQKDAALAAWIAGELGIDEAQQHWEVSG